MDDDDDSEFDDDDDDFGDIDVEAMDSDSDDDHLSSTVASAIAKHVLANGALELRTISFSPTLIFSY